MAESSAENLLILSPADSEGESAGDAAGEFSGQPLLPERVGEQSRER